MRENKIPLATPTMHTEEMEYIKHAFDTNWIAPMGENVDRFEAEIAACLGEGRALALSSCTAALHLALKLCKLQPGEPVLCSDLTFVASVNPICYEGGKPILIDSEYDTWNMDPDALEKAFEKYPQARIVVVVNLYGTPAKLDRLRDICDAHGAIMIEEAAESLGASYRGRQSGTFGTYNVISFNGNKIITTSGGGMLLSKDKAALDKARFWATQAKDPAPYYQHSELGYNYRMSNIVAGIGRGQLLHLEEHRAKKQAIYERYQRGFADLPLQMNPYLPESVPNFWLSCILLDRACEMHPFRIMECLAEHNIESRPIWKPMHLQPLFAECGYICADDVSVNEDIFARGLCLPSDIKMTEEDQQCVIALVRSMF